MKQSLKNGTDMLELINKMQAQLLVLEAKIDTLINRSKPEVKQTPAPAHNTRSMHKAICADCKKDCSIPFKPSGDRPVYCQDCFSKRKMVSMSGIKLGANNQISIQTPVVDVKKKAVAVKKPAGKKKTAAKK